MEESKVENELSLYRVKGEELRKELDTVYADAFDIVEARFRDLKDQSFALDERAKKVEEAEAQLADLEMKSDGFRMEVEARKKELNFLTNQVEVSVGECNAEEVRLSQLRISVEECEAEKMLKESQLSEMVESCRKTDVELGLKGEQLAKMETDLERCRAEVSAEMESLRGAQTHRRQLDEEADRKLKDLTLVQDKIAECEKMFETRSFELVSKEKELKAVNLEIVFEEKTLERAQVFIKNLSEKQVLAEKELDSTRRHLEICISEHESARKELCDVKDRYRECLQDLDIKEKELKSIESILTERNKQVEDGEKKMQHLNSSNEELNIQLKLKQKEVCSISNMIMEWSCELEAKRKHCEQVQSSLTDLITEHKSEESQLNSVKQKIQDSLRDFRSKEKEQVRLRASLMEREKGLKLKEKELSAREGRIDKKAQQLKSTEQKLAKPSRKTQLKAKKQVDLVRDANVCDEKTLQLLLRGHLKKRDQLHLDVLSSVKKSSDPAKLVLNTVNGLYAAHHRTSVKNPKSVQRSSICLLQCLMDMSPKPTTEVQGEAIQFATEWKNTTLVNAESPVEVLEFLHVLAAFSFAYAFDADQVQSLFDVAFLSKYGPSLCKSLGVSALAPVNNVLSLEDKPEEQPTEAPTSNSVDSRSPDVQQSMASSHLPDDEDGLRDIEDSTYFSPNEVSTELPVFKYPGRFVLNAVEDALMNARLRGELSLKEPMLMNLVPLLEELARVVPSTDPCLQYDATRIARRWVKMMGDSVEKLQLEAWAFLQFMVAFGLVKQTTQDQTLQLASYVAHFKQAPKLFQSLGLSHAIPNFVTQLLDKAIYIPAIRFMFYFNVGNNFSPLEFLKEQIISLRLSAKEKRRYESQAEANRDAATLRDIMELIEDFQLEIDIPVDLILKFMVPREVQNLPVQSTHIQASDTVFQSSCISTQVSNPSLPTSFCAAPIQPVNVETYQTGGSTEFQGQSLHQAGFKRPRVDPEDPRPVIRQCFNPPSGFGEFYFSQGYGYNAS